MRFCAFALVAGMATLHCMAQLPHPAVYGAVVPAAMLLVRPRGARVLGFFIAGFLWATWHADRVLAQRIAPPDAGRVATLSGRIAASPTDFGVGIRFPIAVTDLQTLDSRALPPRRVLVSWYAPAEPPAADARCVLKVRLAQPHGARNPGSFDRETWLFRQRFGATASVIPHPENTCVAGAGSATGRMRAVIRERLAAHPGDVAGRGVIAALAIADRSGLDDATWSVLRDTGTAHLLAISGLHISLIAGATFFVVRVLIGLLAPPGRRWPAQRPAAIIAVVVATAYAALAGFPVSAERALVMLVVAMLAVVARRPAVTLDNYALAMACVAIADPLALLGMGFWLSFTAVGCLLLIDLTRQTGSTLARLVRLHVALALGMTPLLGLLYASLPLASPIANLVAVPVVSFVLAPCALAGAALAPFTATGADLLWHAGVHVWSWLWAWLCWLDSVVPALALPATPSPAAIALAIVGVLIAFVPVLPWARVSGVALCSVLLIPPAPDLAPGELRLTVLDVGQGLAAIVETATHVLVYDTGPGRDGYSAGAAVIAPYLRSRGRRQIDQLIVSHGDMDHAGGWPGLAAAVPIARVMLSPGHPGKHAEIRCRHGARWRWDNVMFRVLHPAAGYTGSENDRSCVVQVIAPGGRVLLSGDIENRAETALVQTLGGQLRAEVLIAPHHGSATSSSAGFLAAVAPRFAIFAAGYRNRFGFPHPDIAAAYRAAGIATWTTGRAGAVTVTLRERVARPRSYRATHARYWHLPADDTALR